jgi:hypothetical protein
MIGRHALQERKWRRLQAHQAPYQQAPAWLTVLGLYSGLASLPTEGRKFAKCLRLGAVSPLLLGR